MRALQIAGFVLECVKFSAVLLAIFELLPAATRQRLEARLVRGVGRSLAPLRNRVVRALLLALGLAAAIPNMLLLSAVLVGLYLLVQAAVLLALVGPLLLLVILRAPLPGAICLVAMAAFAYGAASLAAGEAAWRLGPESWALSLLALAEAPYCALSGLLCGADGSSIGQGYLRARDAAAAALAGVPLAGWMAGRYLLGNDSIVWLLAFPLAAALLALPVLAAALAGHAALLALLRLGEALARALHSDRTPLPVAGTVLFATAECGLLAIKAVETFGPGAR